MEFRNDKVSDAAKTTWERDLEEESWRVDDRWHRLRIKFVSMRMSDSASYTGIRIYYKRGHTAVAIEEEIWSEEEEGAWTAPQRVPDGQVIIGFRCND